MYSFVISTVLAGGSRPSRYMQAQWHLCLGRVSKRNRDWVGWHQMINPRQILRKLPRATTNVQKNKSYVGLFISYVGLFISYVGLFISYVGLVKSYVGLFNSYVGDKIS